MPNRKLLALALAALLLFYIAPAVKRGTEARLAQRQDGTEPEQGTGPGFDARTRVTLLTDGRLIRCSLRDYLCGVLCAELPADFPEEAWKAQAVAARSYALYKLERAAPAGHLGADLCGDHTCCTAFRAPEAVLAAWGSGGETLLRRAQRAVDATDGIVAVYEGQVIGAVWHSASADRTASAAQVWGGEVPYLQETESPGGRDKPAYLNRTRIPADRFAEILRQAEPDCVLEGDPAGWLTAPVRSGGGYLVTVEVGGVPVRGSSLRTLLGLPSACMRWYIEGDELVFETEGAGHGVGMSQYGAAALARSGVRWDGILTHYYTGIKLLRKT